jgi:hypothetical protein
MPIRTKTEDGDCDPAIATLLDQLYAVISFEEGGEPNWDGLRAVFSPHAAITRITPEGTDHLNPQRFLALTHDMLEVGAYTSFYEFEVARRVRRFGQMVQVWSLYETRRHRAASGALSRGINGIHIVHEKDGWRVLSLIWDETYAHPELEFSNHLSPGVG